METAQIPLISDKIIFPPVDSGEQASGSGEFLPLFLQMLCDAPAVFFRPITHFVLKKLQAFFVHNFASSC